MYNIQEKNKPEWLFRIDRVDISILGDSWRNWKSHATSILYEIPARFEAPLRRIHNGKSPNALYRRLVKYVNDDHQLEVLYQRTNVKPECCVLARLRFTVLTPSGYNSHSQFIHHVEQILSQHGISHHICYAEVCLDNHDLNPWLSAMQRCVVPRACWAHYGYCLTGEKRRQGFDHARRNLYVFGKTRLLRSFFIGSPSLV